MNKKLITGLLVAASLLGACSDTEGYKEKNYKEVKNMTLNNIETKFCERSDCNGIAVFKLDENTYKLQISGDDFDLLVKGSYYDITYDKNNMELKAFDIAEVKK